MPRFLFNFRELMKAFPDAKVILTVRDNDHGWHKSVKESIYQTIALNAGKKYNYFMQEYAVFPCNVTYEYLWEMLKTYLFVHARIY